MPEPLTDDTIRLKSQVRYRAVGDEGVLVHLENGRVIVVNEVGLHIVQTLAKPMKRSALVASVATEFDVATEQADVDLERFLAELEEEAVLETGQ